MYLAEYDYGGSINKLAMKMCITRILYIIAGL